MRTLLFSWTEPCLERTGVWGILLGDPRHAQQQGFAMRCLFCKSNSSTSRSLEHIIPESLGNHTQTLPPGVVCDKCNNYFAREVEKPFLETEAIRLLRFHQVIPNKRGRVAPLAGVIMPGFPARVHLHKELQYAPSIETSFEALEHVLRQRSGMLIMPAESDLPDGLVVSRFLAKVALEAMAQRLVDYPEGIEYLADEPQLDLMRNHARKGEISSWPYYSRRIYNTNATWQMDNATDPQVIHESDILLTDWNEWFFVLAIFGLELTINYGGPDIGGYERWLAEHDNVSPLYWGKNAQPTSL